MIEFLQTDFRFSDTRGDFIQLCHTGWKQVNYSFTKAGVLRGGHYHKKNREAFFIIEGRIELTLKKDGKTKVYQVKSGDFFALTPWTLHSFSFLEDTRMISMYDLGVEEADGEKDIYS